MKLDKPFDNIIITQSNHSIVFVDGLPVMNTAFDFSSKSKLLAPLDCEITRVTVKPKKQDSYFFIKLPEGSEIFVLHALPVRSGKFKQGEVICNEALPYYNSKGQREDHYHSMIKVNNKWQVLLDYVRRDLPLYFWVYGQTHYKWTNWNTYTDRQLVIINNNEMVKLQLPIQIQTTNTTDLNIREQPTTSSKIINKIPTSTAFTTDIVATGDDVGGNKTWYGVLGGYISGAFVKEIPQTADCSVIEAQLNDANQKLDACTNKLVEAVNELNSFVPETIYRKK